jgi:hypothetical protein
MSLIAAPDASSSLSELPTLLKRWMGLQDEIMAMNNEIKMRRTQSKALKEVILRIMESNRVATLAVNKGAVVHKIRETTEAITDAYLLKHCKDFFGGDEMRAKSLVEFLDARRGTTVRHDLKFVIPKASEL